MDVTRDQPDVIALNEIKPKNGALPMDKNLVIPGYVLHTNISDDKDIRGVIIYVRSTLKSDIVVVPDHSFKDQVTVAVDLNKTKILIQCIYRSGTKERAIQMDDELHKLLINTSNLKGYAQKLIVGDFNHNKIQWTPDPILPDSLPHTSQEAAFITCVQDTLLVQHVDQPTRYRSSRETGELINKPTLDDLIFT